MNISITFQHLWLTGIYDRHFKMHPDSFLIYNGFIRSFTNDGVSVLSVWSDDLFSEWWGVSRCPSLLLHFGILGDIPLIITKMSMLFLIICKENHSEILSFRRVKSSSKTLDRKVINQRKSYVNFGFIWVHFAFLASEPHSNRYSTHFLLIFLYH